MPNNCSDTEETLRADRPTRYPVVRYDRPGYQRTITVPLPAPASQREWVWPVGIAAVCVAGIVGTVAISNTVDRLREYTRDLRVTRHRLADTRAELARRREELNALAERLEQAASVTTGLRDRAVTIRTAVKMEQSREPVPALTDLPVLPSGNLVQSPDAMRAFQGLAILEANVTETVESLGLLTAVLQRSDQSRETYAKAVLWPVAGRVTSEFGNRADPFYGGTRHHSGIDIDGEYGDPIKASADGTVIFAGRDAGYGNLVVLDHGGGVQTFYGHLASMYVREGQRVRGGLVIGGMGSTGRSTGVHCHFEVRVNGQPVDPRRFLANDPDLVRVAQVATTPPKTTPQPRTATARARLIPVGAAAIDRTRRADASAFVGP